MPFFQGDTTQVFASSYFAQMHSRSNSDPELNRDTDRWSKLKWLSEESRPLLPPRTESPAQPIFSPIGSGHQDNTQLNIQVDEAINETDRTIHKLLNRGERLQDINAKAEDLRNTSSLFTRSAHRVEKSLWWDQKYWKVIMYLIAVMFGMGSLC